MELRDIYQIVKSTENRVIELIAKQAEHNAILSEHRNYSIALQAELKELRSRITPIEKDNHTTKNIAKILAAILVGLAIQYLIRTLL